MGTAHSSTDGHHHCCQPYPNLQQILAVFQRPSLRVLSPFGRAIHNGERISHDDAHVCSQEYTIKPSARQPYWRINRLLFYFLLT